jgi:hypothetical protein
LEQHEDIDLIFASSHPMSQFQGCFSTKLEFESKKRKKTAQHLLLPKN